MVVDLPVQPLATSLTELGKQANIEIAFSPQSVESLQAPAVSGRMLPSEALERLLENTELYVESSKHGVIMVLNKSGANEALEETHVTDGKNGNGFLAGLTSVLVAITGVSETQAQSNTEVGGEEGPIDMIVVTGIRRSIESAIENKRESTAIVDGISAEGIGRFPDLNLAESLQRVPGVQIDRRSEQRVGTIALRGLGGSFVRTEVNGQILATPGGGENNFPFGILQSDVVSAVEIYKTPTAAQDAGGMAGIVNIKTASALDLPANFTFVANGDVQYEEMTEEALPKLSLSLGKKFMDETLGLVANVSWEETKFRRDAVNINGYTQCEFSLPDTCQPLDGDISNDIFFPRQLRNIVRQSEGERLTMTFGLDWEPTDNWSFGANGIYGDYDIDDEQLFYRFRLQDTTPEIGDDYMLLSDPIPSDGFGYTAADVMYPNTRARFDSRFYNDIWETQGLTLDSQYSNDAWDLNGVVAYSKAERNRASGRFNVEQRDVANAIIRTGGASDDSGAVFIENSFPPSVTDLEFYAPYTVVDGCDIVGTTAPDIPTYNIESCLNGDFADEQEEFAVQFDGTRQLDFWIFEHLDAFESVQFGVKYRNTQLDNIGYSPSSIEGANVDAITNAYLRPIQELGGAPFFNGHFDNVDQEFFYYVDQFPLIDALTPFSPLDDPTYSVNRLGFNRTLDPGDNFNLERDIFAGYVMMNLGGEFFGLPMRGNIGVRYERTERSAREEFGNLNDDSPINDVPLTAQKDYDNLLPVANFVLDVTDDVVVRLAYADTIVRPSIGATRAGLVFDVPDNPDDTVTISVGAPDLEALEARSIDASIEWYNRPGSMVSAALFYKKVKSQLFGASICPPDGGGYGFGPLIKVGGTCFIVEQDRIININQTFNSDESFDIEGAEFSVTQNLDFLPAPWNAFGGTFNYTYIKADDTGRVNEQTGLPIPLDSTSEHTVNLIGYFETERLGIRLAYNYRDDYFAQGFGSISGGDRIVSDLSRLDLSAQYNFDDHFTVGFEAFNLTDEIIREYQDVEERVRRRDIDGRTYVLTLRYAY